MPKRTALSDCAARGDDCDLVGMGPAEDESDGEKKIVLVAVDSVGEDRGRVGGVPDSAAHLRYRLAQFWKSLRQSSQLHHFRRTDLLHLTIAAVFRLRIKKPNAERPYRAFGYPWLPVLYILAQRQSW